MPLLLGSFLLAIASCRGQATVQSPPIVLRDTFGRDLAGHDLVLVDWDGYMANPAIKLVVEAGPRLYLPARIRLSIDSPMFAFSLFSEIGEQGPSKTLDVTSAKKQAECYVTTLPDRNGVSERAELTVEVTDANEKSTGLRYGIRILDEDRDRPPGFRVHFDYTHDTTGFFKGAINRAIVEQAAADWGYFLSDEGLEAVPKGAEKSWMWNADGFKTGRQIENAFSYRGFLLYAHGIHHDEQRCGAGASHLGSFQMIDGKPTGLKRSGTMSIETTGNWNGLGWMQTVSDADWWRSGNMSTQRHELYSVSRHEMSHAFVFHLVHPALRAKYQEGKLVDPEIREYLGYDPEMSRVEHFTGLVDPVSRTGVFGNEYGGEFPRKRWFLTKFDLLVAKAVGYKLRDVSAFRLLAASAPSEIALKVEKPAKGGASVAGGIPAYDCRIVQGRMPLGVSLDPFTGSLVGAPTESGRFPVTIEVRDNDPKGRRLRVKTALVVSM